MQEVKAIEKTDKNRLAELTIEHRVRKEDQDRVNRTISSLKEKKCILENELIAAQDVISESHNRNKFELGQKFGNLSEVTLQESLGSLQKEMNSLFSDTIDPLHKELMFFSRQKNGGIVFPPGSESEEFNIFQKLAKLELQIRQQQDR